MTRLHTKKARVARAAKTRAQNKALKKKSQTVAVQLPKELYVQAEDLLAQRGTDVATYLKLQLGAFIRCNKPYGLQDRLDFGKYKDAAPTVEEVVRVDPRYIAWLVSVSKTVRFEPDVLELLEEVYAPEIVAEACRNAFIDNERVPF